MQKGTCWEGLWGGFISEALILGCLQRNRRRSGSESLLRNAASPLCGNCHAWLLPGAARFQGAAVSSGCDASLHPCTLIFTANTLPLDCNHDSDSARPDGGCCSCFIKGSLFYRSWSSACESKRSTDGVGRSVCVCLPLGSQGGSLRGWPGGMWGEDPEISIEALHNQSLGPEVLQGRARRQYLHVGK